MSKKERIAALEALVAELEKLVRLLLSRQQTQQTIIPAEPIVPMPFDPYRIGSVTVESFPGIARN